MKGPPEDLILKASRTVLKLAKQIVSPAMTKEILVVIPAILARTMHTAHSAGVIPCTAIHDFGVTVATQFSSAHEEWLNPRPAQSEHRIFVGQHKQKK